jgi:hypothetical protein
MPGSKQLFLIFGIFFGLALLMVGGAGLLFLLVDEINEEGGQLTKLTSLLSFSFPLRWGEENEGNEFTGQTSGWLFGVGCVPVVFNLASRTINRNILLSPRLKRAVEWFTRTNKKYMMPFHTYLSIPAFLLASLHLLFSSCPNPFPELGLITAGLLVLTGVLIKFRIAARISPRLLKWMYQFHASLLVTGLLVSLLIAGHLIMD